MSLNTYSNSGTDKFDLGYIDAFYDQLFIPRKETATKVLEIGVQGGGSIILWRDFFENATVYGVDISKTDILTQEPRIIGFGETDAYKTETVEQFRALEPEGFDVIIDDGPHTLESMHFFLKNYISLLKSGGVMILEDIIDPSWTPSLLEDIDHTKFNATVIDMRDKLKSDQLKQRWSNGLDVIIVECK